MCGTPILAEENIDEYVPILQGELGAGKYFALRTHGDSMVNEVNIALNSL